MREEILEYLYDNNIGSKIVLNDFLKTLLTNNNQSLLQPVLHPLSKEGLASFEGMVGHIGSLGHELESETFTGELTAAGIQEAKEIKRRKWQDKLLERQTVISEESGNSVIDTNEFTKKNANKNLRILWLTLFVAATSTFSTIKSCQISSQQSKQLKLKEQKDSSIQLLQKKLTETDVTLSFQKKTIDSLVEKLNDTIGKDTATLRP